MCAMKLFTTNLSSKICARGAIFVEELDQVPDDVIVIFSAHGVSQAVRTEAAGRGLKVFDATCPLVTKVHIEVARYSRDGRECILIGHAGHPEVEGTMGQYDAANGGAIYLVEDEEDVASLQVRNPEALAFVTQTTLSMDDTSRVIDALRKRFPAIGGPRKDDICYATQNRQDAVKQLADECDVVLVVGSPNSSTPIACASWPSAWRLRRTSSTAPKTCNKAGSTGSSVSASLRALRPRSAGARRDPAIAGLGRHRCR